MKIAVIDYGSGNLRSVLKAVEKVGADIKNFSAFITSDAGDLLSADRVIFPGQGAMPDCMHNLRRTGLEEAVKACLREKPFFAVCLGEQMLFDFSEEGNTPALGIFPGDVVRFPSGRADENGLPLKVPQMGWNRVKEKRDHPLWDGIPDESWFYFVHSYYVVPKDPSVITGTTVYGSEITVAVGRENIFATQFHPEKSASHGLRLYRNFLSWKP